MTSVIENLIVEYKTTKKNLEEKVQAEFSKLFTDFFAKYDDVELVRFAAFTPYFNDGEPCIYGVNDMECVLKSQEDTEDYDRDSYGYGENGCTDSSWGAGIPWPSEEMKNDFAAIAKAVRQIPDEIMEGALGEGLHIITRDGIETQEYDHD